MKLTLISSRLLIIPYFLLIIVGLLIPSISYRGALNPKTIVFTFTAISLATYFLVRQRLYFQQLKILLFLTTSLAFLVLWLILGSIQDITIFDIRFDQFKLFLLTISVPVATLYLLNENKITPQQVFKTVIYSNLTYCFVKIVMVVLHLMGIIDIWELLGASGAQIMKMAIFGDLQRLQSSLDISTPFILFFVLQSTRLGLNLSTSMKAFYIVVSLLSNFLAFSRFLLAVYFISVALYLLTVGKRKIVTGMIVSVLIGISVLGAIGFDNAATSIERRFYSKNSYRSDRTRMEQFDALYEEHEQVPLLGKGLGGYAEDYIRDNKVMHSYEVQWVAFLMQFGIIGLCLICVPLGMIGYQLLQPPYNRFMLSCFCLYVLWIISGFTNPFLISLQSGIIYTLFLLLRRPVEPIPG